jgi:hypothetical protein
MPTWKTSSRRSEGLLLYETPTSYLFGLRCGSSLPASDPPPSSFPAESSFVTVTVCEPPEAPRPALLVLAFPLRGCR